MDWILGVTETYRFQWSEVMRMPFRTFMALHRHAVVKGTNMRIAREFQESVAGR